MKKIAFIGSKSQGYDIWQLMPPGTPCLTLRDSNDPRTAYNIFTRQRNVWTLDSFTLNAFIAEHDPEFIFVCGWYEKIPTNKYPNITFIGIHNSLLPLNRGGAPLVWTLIKNHATAGVTFFKMDSGFDTGPIYCQTAFPVDIMDNIASLTEKATCASVELMRNNFLKIIEGMVPTTQTKCFVPNYQRTEEDALIPWEDMRDTYNHCRAQREPYPKAFTIINGHKYYVHIWLENANNKTEPK